MNDRPKNTGTTAKKLPISPIGLLLLLALAVVLFNQADPSNGTISPEDARCRTDLNCWAKKNLRSTRKCIEPIERSTNYEFKWTDSLFESKFTKYNWHHQAAFTITYLGDALLQQNQDGAFVRMTYECDIDPISEQVISVRVHPGRLDPRRNGA